MVNFEVPFRDTGGLAEHLPEKFNSLTTKNKDWIVVIVGGEGLGKTTLAMRWLFHLSKEAIFKDGKINIKENICINGDGERFAVMLRGPKHRVLILDEAQKCLFAKDTMSAASKNVVKDLMACRFKNDLLIILLPDYFSLDKDIRTRRVDVLIKITKEGKFKGYKKKKAIKIGTQKDWKGVRHSSFGSWNTTYEDDFAEVMRQYVSIEETEKLPDLPSQEEAQNETNRRAERWLKLRELGLTQKTIAQVEGVTQQLVSYTLKKGNSGIYKQKKHIDIINTPGIGTN